GGAPLRRSADRCGPRGGIDMRQRRRCRRHHTDRHSIAAGEFRQPVLAGGAERPAPALGGRPERFAHLTRCCGYQWRANPVMQWYAVYTQPHAEPKALEHILRQGYSAYLPRYRTKVSHARRRQIVLRPLFPRYLFAGIDRATM